MNVALQKRLTIILGKERQLIIVINAAQKKLKQESVNQGAIRLILAPMDIR
jgi:hypothetical protein